MPKANPTTIREWMQRLPRRGPVDREAALIAASRGKRVVHIGFADEPFLAPKLAQGRWLHARLADVASSLVGIDLSGEGVRWARAQGYETYVADAQSPAALEALGIEPADVVVAGEIIEHLDAPGPFLRAVRTLTGPRGLLVVTTPNAYKHVNFFVPILGSELVHPDHTAWHSPSTLRRLLDRNGWTIEDMAYYYTPLRPTPAGLSPWRRLQTQSANVLRLLVALGSRALPYWSDGIIAWCRPAEEGAQPERNASA
jgi:SAM-dependent methyltransferase